MEGREGGRDGEGRGEEREGGMARGGGRRGREEWQGVGGGEGGREEGETGSCFDIGLYWIPLVQVKERR